MGCTEPAVAMIEHPDHGERTVCEEHVDGHRVIANV